MASTENSRDSKKSIKKGHFEPFIVLIIIILTAYAVLNSYEDQLVTNAIYNVHYSVTIINYSFKTNSSPTSSGEYSYIIKLSNSADFNISYSYYVEMYIGDQYIQTIQFQTVVPAEREMIIETKSSVGSEGYNAILTNSNPIYHWKGNFKGSGRAIISYLYKSWSTEWDTS